MREELMVYGTKPLRAIDIRAQVNLIQEVMKTVMQEGQHFGKVPGCGDKPTLLKAGAEKIMSTFRLAADPEVEDMSAEGIIRYRVKCKLISADGVFVGAGIGECSSAEEKYAWRYSVSDAEWNATPETDRRTKYKKDSTIKQVKTNPYDLANTVLKMAKKRALVDAVLTVTAASDIFTQDIEDMPEEVLGKKPPIQKPQEKKEEVADSAVISEAQRRRFYAIAKSTGVSDESIKEWLKNEYSWEHTTQITRELYEEICERVKVELGERQPGEEK